MMSSGALTSSAATLGTAGRGIVANKYTRRALPGITDRRLIVKAPKVSLQNFHFVSGMSLAVSARQDDRHV